MDSMSARNGVVVMGNGQKQATLLYQSDQGSDVIDVIANVDE